MIRNYSVDILFSFVNMFKAIWVGLQLLRIIMKQALRSCSFIFEARIFLGLFDTLMSISDILGWRSQMCWRAKALKIDVPSAVILNQRRFI